MKVATRITVATAVVVMIATSIYAVFDLRGRVAERRSVLEREARAVALTLRATFELSASAFRAPSEAQLEIMSVRTGGWRVSVLPRERALDPSPGPNASQEQLKLLQTMTELPNLCTTSPDLCANLRGNRYFYALPLRAVQAAADTPQTVVGMIEISRPSNVLSVTADDLFGAIALVALIVVVTTVVVGLLASRFVSRPITKLLSGIDDVAKGDLSHVLLSERDDEIGQLATRFNDMTFSLRESRGETQRQNEDKLALEQRLGQTEKLATIGQLAAEIAHEVGTPLNVIAGRARSIQKKSRDHDAVEKNAEIVAEQTARITRIIQRLLDFTRRKVGTAGKQDINVNELSLMTMELLSAQFSSAKVRTRLERAEGLPRVSGDPDRLQQVMINLLLNAVQAMPDGGALAVETAIVRRTRPGLEDGAEQRFVSFAVRDTGIGVPEDIRDKIFDPFYTTKEGQGGTGLGLAVCSGIVKEHDGWIDIESNTNGGTIFRVFLPA
ncbi:MAG TPA: HAMP domain-containing sensor histidine kinase [Kofleriaceae bacterium]|nr:HAMP domain-containing sensor histidine kinase [Kofleriaceae bacterium]